MQDFTVSHQRLYKKLCSDLGPQILGFLSDPNIHEIMLNPNGKLWIDSMLNGQISMGHLSSANAYAIINCIAGIHGLVISQNQPRIEAELPNFEIMRGERFTAAIPPIVAAPCFTIRKHSDKVFTLDDYVNSQRISQTQAKLLTQLIQARKNILICGGPGSGKTTMINALIHEAVQTDVTQRFIILEDLPELQCTAPNSVAMSTSATVTMRDLLQSAMRMRPDRILIGEVRGAEALDMLKAWNTGCPGGLGTIHANNAEHAVQRIIDLVMEAGLTNPPFTLIQHTVDAIVAMRREHQQGFIKEIVTLRGRNHEKFLFEILA